MRIVNWPDKVDAPGPMFAYKKLGSEQLRCLGAPYVEHCLEGTDTIYPKVVPWSDGELFNGRLQSLSSLNLPQTKLLR